MISSWYKIAVPVNGLDDFFTDDTVETYNQYQTNKENEENLPVIKTEDIGQYMADEYGDEDTFDDAEFDEKIEQPYRAPEVDEDVPVFDNVLDAIHWAIVNNKVLRINYITKKGIDLTRIVEPHLIFQAKNGNTIVVTFDRSVRNIRAFIVSNIINYIITGKEFKPRMRIVTTEPEKGINTMGDIKNNLMKIAKQLEDKGLVKSAAMVKDVESALEDIRTSQYVGVQGYWIRNRRCWDNCYRQKRTTDPEKSAQVVWGECWDEYLKSINNPTSGWEKYAEETKVTQGQEGKRYKAGWHKHFVEAVNKTMKEKKIDRPEAIYSFFDEEADRIKEAVLDHAGNLTSLAVTLNDNGFTELGKKVAEVSNEVLKQADFGGSWWEKTKDFFRKPEGKIAERVNRIIQKINQIIRVIQGGQSRWASSQQTQKEISKIAQLGQTTQPAPPTPPTPAQNRNLKYVTDEYHQFVSDLREEMGILNKMWMKNPQLGAAIQPALQAMTNFITSSDKTFAESGGFNGRAILGSLGTLLNELVGNVATPAPEGTQNPAAPTGPPSPAATQNGPGWIAPQQGATPPTEPNVGNQLSVMAQDPSTKQLLKLLTRAGNANLEALFDLFSKNNVPLNTNNYQQLKSLLTKT